MASPPDTQEYGTASAAAYTATQSGGFVTPEGWTVIAESPASEQSAGFSAIALKDPSGNVIIANEGTVPGLTSYDLGTLGADAQITDGNTPKALSDAVEFAESVQEETGQSVYVTGHSLGGMRGGGGVSSVRFTMRRWRDLRSSGSSRKLAVRSHRSRRLRRLWGPSWQLRVRLRQPAHYCSA